MQVYIGPDDPDSEYHGTVCEVVKIIEDNLDIETGRDLDAYSYDALVKYIVGGELSCGSLATENQMCWAKRGHHPLNKGFYCLEMSFASATNNLLTKGVCRVVIP